jgi:hypothetical protein
MSSLDDLVLGPAEERAARAEAALLEEKAKVQGLLVTVDKLKVLLERMMARVDELEVAIERMKAKVRE